METKPHTPSAVGSLSVDDVNRLIDEHFPGLRAAGRWIQVEAVSDRRARCRLRPAEHNIRPGGTISGPALFTLADFAIYAALIGTLGAPAIPAVTSNLNINFLLRPEPADVIAEATLLRLGQRLAYADVRLLADGSGALVAHATGTYALAAK